MPEPLRVAMFCEDQGHEALATSLIRRLARELGIDIALDAASTRGGHGRVIAELKAYQHRLASFVAQGSSPDLFVVVVDANCKGWSAMRTECRQALRTEWAESAIVACPDPHVERWCMADVDAFARVVGERPAADPGKCERDLYKKLFRNAVDRAGLFIATGIEELFADIVDHMDFYRAGQLQPSLGAFVGDLRAALQRLKAP